MSRERSFKKQELTGLSPRRGRGSNNGHDGSDPFVWRSAPNGRHRAIGIPILRALIGKLRAAPLDAGSIGLTVVKPRTVCHQGITRRESSVVGSGPTSYLNIAWIFTLQMLGPKGFEPLTNHAPTIPFQSGLNRVGRHGLPRTQSLPPGVISCALWLVSIPALRGIRREIFESFAPSALSGDAVRHSSLRASTAGALLRRRQAPRDHIIPQDPHLGRDAGLPRGGLPLRLRRVLGVRDPRDHADR